MAASVVSISSRMPALVFSMPERSSRRASASAFAAAAAAARATGSSGRAVGAEGVPRAEEPAISSATFESSAEAENAPDPRRSTADDRGGVRFDSARFASETIPSRPASRAEGSTSPAGAGTASGAPVDLLRARP